MSLTDPYLTLIWVLAGGFVLLILGLRTVSEATQAATHRQIKWGLDRMGGISSSISSGAFISFFVQSGYSSNLMASSFAVSGLFSLEQMAAFLLGTNFGTILTPFVLAVDWGSATAIVLTLGAFPMLYGGKFWSRNTGKLIFGFGLLALCQWLVFANTPVSIRILYSLSAENHIFSLWPVCILFFALAILIRSSVALISLVGLLVSMGIFNSLLGAFLVLFINVGSALPGLIDAWKYGAKARLGQVYNLIMNIFIFVVGLLFLNNLFPVIVEMSQKIDSAFPLKLISPGFLVVLLTHFAFNFLVLAFGGILLKPFLFGLSKLFPGSRKKEPQKLVFIGRSGQGSASLGLALVRVEVKKMCAMVESILLMCRDQIRERKDFSAADKVIKYEEITDNICEEVQEYVAKLAEGYLIDRQVKTLHGLSRVVEELERVADQCKSVVCLLNDLEQTDGTEAVMSRVDRFFEDVIGYFELVFLEITGDSPSKEVDKLEFVENRAHAMKASYLTLLKEIQSEKIPRGQMFYFGELIISLNSIRSHTLNIYQAYHSAGKS